MASRMRFHRSQFVDSGDVSLRLFAADCEYQSGSKWVERYVVWPRLLRFSRTFHRLQERDAQFVFWQKIVLPALLFRSSGFANDIRR